MNDRSDPSGSTSSPGLHAGLANDDPRERFLADLFDRLWATYRDRVPYVRRYEEVVREQGGRFVNDHIAFRTIAQQRPSHGIHSVSRPFEALGYVAVGCYDFPNKHLSAIHLQHANPRFPKLFVSQLKVWELSTTDRDILSTALDDHRPSLSDELLVDLR